RMTKQKNGQMAPSACNTKDGDNSPSVLTRADDTPQVKAKPLYFVFVMYYNIFDIVCQELFLQKNVLS
ncbi:MAG: hypothetical protein IJ171_04550, partial [Ruminococcus sp.]|nr:hypothetical protein [Ruminococcus sp.]